MQKVLLVLTWTEHLPPLWFNWVVVFALFLAAEGASWQHFAGVTALSREVLHKTQLKTECHHLQTKAHINKQLMNLM